jgi:hypothetical protein
MRNVPARNKTFPAPVRGWVENENLAMNSGVGAMVAENGFPLTYTVRVRGGDLKVATIGAAVTALMPYRSGTTAKLFAASATAVYNISSLNPDTAPAADISSLTSGAWVGVQIGTAGGQFLLMVNGADTGRTYDGTSWAAMSITGADSADFSHVWIHANRAWFIEKNSMTAWFLPVDSIGGAVTDFALGGVFQQGGALAFGGTWSADSGNGMSDRCVFVSTEGEVAVYEGIDPSDPETFGLVGRYDIGRPVSMQAIRTGGDLLIATTDGIVPLSAIVMKDPAELSMAAVTRPVEAPWARAIRTNDAVQMLKWQTESMGIIGFPEATYCFVVNLTTGAWSKWTNKDIQALALHNDQAYFGDSSGDVFLLEGSGSDNGAQYVFRWSLLPDHLGSPGQIKTVALARATFRSLRPFNTKLDVATDYGRDFEIAPDVYQIETEGALWDLAQWDVSLWDNDDDSEAKVTATTYWRAINRSGIVVGPQVQISLGSPRKPDVEFVSFDAIYDVGGTVV